MLKHLMKVSRLSMLVIIAITLLTVVPLSVSAATDEREVDDAKFVLNGSSIKLSSPLHMVNGRLYMPVGLVATALSASVTWNNDYEEATIVTKSNDKVVLGNGVPTVYFNDQRYKIDSVPYLYDSRLYVPVRYIAEITHATAIWDMEEKTLQITSVPLEVVSDDNTLADISSKNNLTQAEVVKRNGFSSKNQIKNGMKLAVIIPSLLKNKADPYTEEDIKLLSKIVMVESGYESYEGQLAVANVILNRVSNSNFPDSIKGVIYSGKQFPPAHNGLLDKAKPNNSSMKAAKDALNGKNNVVGALYFFNPKYADSYFKSKTVIATIGNHRFVK